VSNSNNQKESNFDLDLLPVISLMSICICFLLLTAVWTQIGSVNIEQGMGQESSKESTAEKSASIWIMMKSNGEVSFKMMDGPEMPASLQERSFLIGAAGSGWPALERHATELKRSLPTLKTALIMPEGRVNYGDVIRMMDRLKMLEIAEIGIAPL
jgi:biopolymer transport protein TolR